MRRFATITAAAALLTAASAAANAQATTVAEAVPGRSAAVNVCDPGARQLGVRALQPAEVLAEAMATRFSAQWLRPSTGAWEAVPGSESPWIDAGPGPWLYRTSGWTRTFDPAPAGTSFTLRGVVEMRWGSRVETLVTGSCRI